MKRIIAEWALLFLLCCCTSACAQDNLLTNLEVVNRRITGTLDACFGAGTEYEQWETILVDCPLPAQTYSGEVFETEYRRISKKDVQKALKAIGQSEQVQFISDKTGFRFTSAEKCDPSADISKEAAAAQANRIGVSFFEALGVEVAVESAYASRPYDEDAFMRSAQERLSHAFSQIDAQLDRQRAQWKRTQKYETRGPQYTRVSFHMMTDGMRVAPWPAYPAGYSDEPDAQIAFDTGVSVLVSDSGELVQAQAGCIVQVKHRRMPQEKDAAAIAALEQQHIRAESWQEALAQAQQMEHLPRNNPEQSYQMESMDEPVTRYASQAVVTEIYPCLYTISKDEWVMIWRIETLQQFADGCRF